ncbi:hypothetical protein ACR6HW_14325 [Fusibacter sp. JL298sf-3]
MHDTLINTHEQMFSDLKRTVADLERVVGTVKERVVVVEQSTKSAHHRLDSQEEQTKAIIKMATNIEYMARQIEDMLYLLKQHDERLDAIEKRPGNALIAYTKLFISALITGGVGIALGMLLKTGR